MTIKVRTHGGLGNQLFQVLYAIYCSCKYFEGCATVELYHDVRYPHGFNLSQGIIDLGDPIQTHSLDDTWVLKWRAVKVLEKLGINPGQLWIGSDLYLDGYFQDVALFDNAEWRLAALSKLATRSYVKNNRKVIHLRLGDFFESKAKAVEYALERIGGLAGGCDLFCTNDDYLLGDDNVRELLDKKNITLVPTNHLPDFEVLRLMGGYAEIYSNGSTFAMWAALLGKSTLYTTNTDNLNFLDKFYG